MSKKANQPAAKFTIGYISATVWENDGYYSVEVSRTYKVDDEYRNTSSLGPADIENARMVLRRAGGWIASQ